MSISKKYILLVGAVCLPLQAAVSLKRMTRDKEQLTTEERVYMLDCGLEEKIELKFKRFFRDLSIDDLKPGDIVREVYGDKKKGTYEERFCLFYRLRESNKRTVLDVVHIMNWFTGKKTVCYELELENIKEYQKAPDVKCLQPAVILNTIDGVINFMPTGFFQKSELFNEFHSKHREVFLRLPSGDQIPAFEQQKGRKRQLMAPGKLLEHKLISCGLHSGNKTNSQAGGWLRKFENFEIDFEDQDKVRQLVDSYGGVDVPYVIQAKHTKCKPQDLEAIPREQRLEAIRQSPPRIEWPSSEQKSSQIDDPRSSSEQESSQIDDRRSSSEQESSQIDDQQGQGVDYQASGTGNRSQSLRETIVSWSPATTMFLSQLGQCSSQQAWIYVRYNYDEIQQSPFTSSAMYDADPFLQFFWILVCCGLLLTIMLFCWCCKDICCPSEEDDTDPSDTESVVEDQTETIKVKVNEA